MLTVGPLSATNSHTFIEQIQASIPVPVRWKDGKHIASRLLTPAENTKVFKILGSKRKVSQSLIVAASFPIALSVINVHYSSEIYHCFGNFVLENNLQL